MLKSSPEVARTTLQHSKSHFEHFMQVVLVQNLPIGLLSLWALNAALGLGVDGHMMHTATPVQHNVDVQGLDGAPSGVLRNSEIQNSLLCSPAEVGTPTRTWKSLVVDPLREIFPGCDPLATHGVVESLPTHQSGFTSLEPPHLPRVMMEFAGLWQSTTPELHNDSFLQRTTSMARSVRITVGA